MSFFKTNLEKSVDTLINKMEASTARLLKEHQQGYNLIWNSASTPDEVIGQLGPRATQTMAVAWAVVQVLLTAIPAQMASVEYLPRRGLTYNQDGSITLSPPPEGYDAWGRPIPEPQEPDPTDPGE